MKGIFAKTGIFAKLTVLQAVCTILTGAVLYIVMDWQISAKIHENFLARGDTIVESLARTVQPYLVEHDLTSVQSALDAVIDTPSVDCAYIVSPDGRVLAHTFVPRFPEELLKLRIAPGQRWSKPRSPGDGGKQLVFFSRPVLTGIVGSVYLGINSQPLESSIREMKLTVLTLIAVILLGGLFGFAVEARRIVAPVRALTLAAQKLSVRKRVDFEPLAVRSEDELGALTRAFNDMVAQIKDHEENLERRAVDRTEQWLASERRFKLAQGVLGLGTWEIEVGSGKVHLSGEWEQLCGHGSNNAGIISVSDWLDRIHPGDRQRMSQADETQAITGACNGQLRVIWPDGSVHWILRRSHNIVDEEGRLQRVVGVSFDITEQKRNEDQLRVLSNAVEQSPVSILLTDTEGAIQYANPMAAEVSGYALNELLGQNPSILQSGNTSPEQYADLWNTIPHGIWRGILHNRKKSGESFWEAATIGPLRDDSGVVTHYLAVKENITERRAMAEDLEERKRVERELLQAKENAEAANKAKSAFLANMSHEIRTPLNAVLGYTQLMLRDPELGGDAKENLRIINRSGEHLLGLINDILDMSRIEAGKTTLTPVPFDLHELLKDLDLMFGLRADAKGLAFEVVVPRDCKRWIEADKGKLRQVLVNLVGNAIKFTDHGSVQLSISTRTGVDGLLKLAVAVEDTGPGILDSEQSSLFQPFSQSEVGRSSKGGTGLGLSISQQFVRLMGGEIGLSSRINAGSTFYFEVPVIAAGTEAEPHTPKVSGIQDSGELRVLVADDEVHNRGWLTRLLGILGFTVREAADGAAAIEVWRAWKPQLILMDMRMPVMDGVEATRRIRTEADGESVSIFMLTAHALEDKRQEALECGVNDFITKPCAEEELLRKIKLHLGVHYAYTEDDAEQTNPSPVPEMRLSEDLPEALATEIRKAVQCGNKRQLDGLIDRVGEISGPSARLLRNLADNYDYDGLNELMKQGAPEQVHS